MSSVMVEVEEEEAVEWYEDEVDDEDEPDDVERS